jgi:hypothetical protein
MSLSFGNWGRLALSSLVLGFALAGPSSAQIGTVRSWMKYTQHVLDPFDGFGYSVAGLGDVDGDGIGDVAVGAPGDDDGPSGGGAVWILFLNADGTVRSHQKISSISGWFDAELFVDAFGTGVAGLGDLDGNGVPDLAVAAAFTRGIGSRSGAAWILFLERDGRVKSWRKLAPLTSLNGSQLADSISCLGDLDGNGAPDLALGHRRSIDGGIRGGAVWILFLANDGTLAGEQKIGSTLGGFGGALAHGDEFGISSASPGDLDGDGVPDLAVGAYLDDDGGLDAGALWILFLQADGTVKSWRKLSATSRGFGARLDPGDHFGKSVCAAGDLDGDGIGDLAVGADLDDDGGPDKGAVWFLTLNADGSVKAWQKVSQKQGDFAGKLESTDFPTYASDRFGAAVALLGDLDGNGFGDFAVGTPGHGTVARSNTDSGAAWILRMKGGSVVSERQFVGEPKGWGSGRSVEGKFGSSLAALDDVDGDGIGDLAVGAPESGFLDAGQVWVLFLKADGTVKSTQRMGIFGEGGFAGPLAFLDFFGCALASPGDLDGDGIGDLAVGADGADDGGAEKGAVWILFLRADGSVKDEQKISETQGGLGAVLSPQGRFGSSLAPLGDFDGDGLGDIVVGSELDGGRGSAWILLLNADGTVKAAQRIGSLSGGFGGTLGAGDAFGCSAAFLGDLDGDGIGDLAVGAEGDDDFGADQGAVWILFLAADGTVKSQAKINEGSGLGSPLDPLDRFGGSVGGLGDVDGDGIPDLAVGAYLDDDGGLDQGAVWILLLTANGGVRQALKIGEGRASFGGQLNKNDRFGASVAGTDLDGDGVLDLLVGAPRDGDMGLGAGSLWGLFLEGAQMGFESGNEQALQLRRLRSGSPPKVR